MTKLSKNLSLKEAIKSNTAIARGISNMPTEEEIKKLERTAKNIFQPIRQHFNLPIGVTSMFRSKALNKALRGSGTSQHCKSEAIDMDADMFGGKCLNNEGLLVDFTNKMIFDYVKENMEYDQLIWEYGTSEEPAWVHISYKETNNRMRALKAYKDSNNKTQYSYM